MISISAVKRIVVSILFSTVTIGVAAGDDFAKLGRQYDSDIRPLITKYCLDCHSGDEPEGEYNFEGFHALANVRRDPNAWIKVRQMLADGEMPPKDESQPKPDEKKRLVQWVAAYLHAEALASAGDPGPVVLRRLSNAEYTYTIRDLTGVPLDPAREFPIDGAAGEGFTNTGSALVMSPALVQKYLAAAKGVAKHAVLVPDGISFSPHATRRDQTDELVARIQEFYREFTLTTSVNIDVGGTGRVPNEGGAIPLAQYLAASLEEREALRDGSKTAEHVARARKLNAKYFARLWTTMSRPPDRPSLLLDRIRDQWQTATPADVNKLVATIEAQQKVLFKYNRIGHVESDGKPRAWLEAANPLTSRREFQVKLPDKNDGPVSIFLSASDAGDSNADDFVVWQNPRLIVENGPDIPLRDLAGVAKRLHVTQKEALSKTASYLAAAAKLETIDAPVTDQLLAEIAASQTLDVDALKVWANYLGTGPRRPVSVPGHFEKSGTNKEYDFVHLWRTSETPLVGANSSDRQVHIPGIARPRKVFAHPSPTLFAAIGWQSPLDGVVKIEAEISDAHSECGSGQEWFLQHRTGRKTANLWHGKFAKGGSATMEPKQVSVRKGQLISFILGPGKDYYCDLTAMDLTISELKGK